MLRFAFQPRHPVTQVAFTADGSEVVTAQPFTGIAVRNRLTGEPRVTFPLPRSPHVYRMEVHPATNRIVVFPSSANLLLDPVTGEELTAMHWSVADQAVVHAPEMLLGWGYWWAGSTTGDRVTLELFDRGWPVVSHGTRAMRLNAPVRLQRLGIGPVVAFSRDGALLALGGGEDVRVFDLRPLEEGVVNRYKAPLNSLLTLDRPDPTAHGTFADKNAEHWLPPVAFDHTGRTLFMLGLRNRVQRIDLATGGVMNEWGWRCEPIRSLAVSPDGLTAAAGCQRGELVLWDLE